MWRWLVPIGMTSFAVVWLVFGNHMYSMPPHGDHPPGAVTMTWLYLMVAGVPTILLYRLLIAAGERALPRRPRTGAAALVLAGALLPPLAFNLWVAGSSGDRDFVGPVPARADTIAVEAAFNHREAFQVGIAQCADPCLRLLFGGAARRVIVGDPKAQAPLAQRPHWQEGEPTTYAPAPALRLERRPVCPPVVTDSTHWYRTGNFVGAPQIGPARGSGSGTSTADRAIALIAAGLCPVAEPARFTDAQLILGWRTGRDPRDGPQPSAAGLYGYAYQFIDRRTGAGWTRPSQHVELTHTRRWIFPFAFLPSRSGWIAATLNTTAPNRRGEDDMVQNWRSLGFTLPDIPATDWRQVRGMLMAAIALPPSAPRDARHQLVPQYLAMLRARTADATDRALLPRLAADPRIAADDLQQLAGLPDARRAEAALLVRIRHGDTKGDDLRRLAHVAYELPVADMPAFLAMLQRLGADPERGREFQSLFEMYTAMERRQAEARREPAAANGAHPAADFGFSGARPLRPLAFALDIAALVALHLTVLALVLIRYRRRLRKGPPPEQPAA